jgi:hypothetical protein
VNSADRTTNPLVAALVLLQGDGRFSGAFSLRKGGRGVLPIRKRTFTLVKGFFLGLFLGLILGLFLFLF